MINTSKIFLLAAVLVLSSTMFVSAANDDWTYKPAKSYLYYTDGNFYPSSGDAFLSHLNQFFSRDAANTGLAIQMASNYPTYYARIYKNEDVALYLLGKNPNMKHATELRAQNLVICATQKQVYVKGGKGKTRAEFDGTTCHPGATSALYDMIDLANGAKQAALDKSAKAKQLAEYQKQAAANELKVTKNIWLKQCPRDASGKKIGGCADGIITRTKEIHYADVRAAIPCDLYLSFEQLDKTTREARYGACTRARGVLAIQPQLVAEVLRYGAGSKSTCIPDALFSGQIAIDRPAAGQLARAVFTASVNTPSQLYVGTDSEDTNLRNLDAAVAVAKKYPDLVKATDILGTGTFLSNPGGFKASVRQKLLNQLAADYGVKASSSLAQQITKC
jgi:hypothetical protein